MSWFFRIQVSYLLLFAFLQEFKVRGGCKVKDTSHEDYRQIKIVMDDHEDKVFELRRHKQGGNLWT